MREDTRHIPLSSVRLSDVETGLVNDCLSSSWISSRGKYIALFEEANRSYYGRSEAVAVSSGTAALHLALASLGIGPGDEVILPAFTFAATANAVIHCGAAPVLADVGSDDWCLDPESYESLITSRTRAILPVHIYGQAANLEELLALAEAHSVALVEDCAQAHGATYGGRKVGSFGAMSCFSFFANKIITTGEGGLCLTDDPALASRIRTLRNHGLTNASAYWHTEVGYNYRMTNIQAAIGVGQMQRIDEILLYRERTSLRYRQELGKIGAISFQEIISGRSAVCWLFPVMLEANAPADVVQSLRGAGIESRRVFTPLHCMPPYKELRRSRDLRNSEKLFGRGLCLPTYEGITEDEIGYVCDALADALQR